MAASWTSSNDMLMGSLLSSPKSSNIDLMQNCDLPPPLKVFSGSDKTVLSSMNRVFSLMGREYDNNNNNSSEFGDEGGGDEKVGVLKALRLSQTRAREAEKKASELEKERDSVSNALLRESSHVLGYKQCVRILEVEVMKLKHQWQQQAMIREENCEDESSGGASNWIVALAVCVGIAGVGIAYGYKYLF